MKISFMNKEVSWLSFNGRILEEAADPTVPLLERLRFLGIFSSNLDEFFRIRVAYLKRLSNLGKKVKTLTGEDPKIVLEIIQNIIINQHAQFDKIYQDMLQELKKERIYIIDETKLNSDQAVFVRNFFLNEVRPKLIPVMLDQTPRFPPLRDKMIYLAIHLLKSDNPYKKKYALIEIPTTVLPRFIILPSEPGDTYVILLDDVIRYGLVDIFSTLKYDTYKAYALKLTRDAELELDTDYSQSYIGSISKSLKKRKQGAPLRFVYDAEMPKDLLDYFIKRLNLTKVDTLMPGSRYHNHKDFITFPHIGKPHLRYPKLEHSAHPEIDPNTSLLKIVSNKDLLLHFPYNTFDYIIDLIREASINPKVSSIKMTIYRAAATSSVINALINAARNGKQITVILELQARFDEEANIKWADWLQEEGVNVIFGVPGLKVHAKMCLITEKKKHQTKKYAILGTGNFNEDTAKIYSDHFLFTADPRLTDEIDKIFDFFEKNYKTVNFHHLMVAPFNFRKKILNLIQNEIDNVKKGNPAYIFIKINNLADTEIIEQLYAASKAGVKIKLIVRSMFSLIPGAPKMSSNIEAISIVDRFLEHSRIFVFCNNGETKYYLSSADLMQRNLDRRIELVFPIYDDSIKSVLQQYLDCQWTENPKARKLTCGLDNTSQPA